MFKYFLIFFFLFLNSNLKAEIKDKIIQNLKNTNNLDFKFEQNINGKIENGNCTIEYPKKIFCTYNNINKKILVSNGRSLVIKTKNGDFYRYSIKRTPLNYILDKNFLIEKIRNLSERVINDQYINYTMIKDDNEINIFFDKKNYNLLGWQTLDVYQNLIITYISSLKVNQPLKKNFFKLPTLD